MNYADLKPFIEGLTITQGRHAGEAFTILPFQERFLRGFCRTEGGAALSVGRGNGKSTLIGALACAAIDGPMKQPNSEILVVASSHTQGQIVFKHILAFMGKKVHNRMMYQLVNNFSDAYLLDKKTGISVRTCGSDSKRLHGAAPLLLIYDEMAQWPPNSVKPMLAALETSRGKIPNARSVWIGTRPEDNEHPFSQALDGRNKEVEYHQLHSAGKDDPPFRRRTWLKANPGLPHFPDLEKTIKRESGAAKDNPELLPQFKALRLNQGVADHDNMTGLVGIEQYKESEVETGEITMPYVLGLDLSKSFAMTSAAAISIVPGEDGRHVVDAFATWPGIVDKSSGLPSLDKRRSTDGGLADYRTMHSRGELILQEGRRTVDIPTFLQHCINRWGEPEVIVADSYRATDLQDSAIQLGYEEDNGLVFRRMGPKDGGEDVRRFHKMMQDRALALVDNRLMKSAFGVARLMSDAAGNQWIAKHNERAGRGRDDAAVAVVLAAAELDRMRESGPVEAETPQLVYSEWDW